MTITDLETPIPPPHPDYHPQHGCKSPVQVALPHFPEAMSVLPLLKVAPVLILTPEPACHLINISFSNTVVLYMSEQSDKSCPVLSQRCPVQSVSCQS